MAKQQKKKSNSKGKKALIVSGGGARGAFAVGAIKALQEQGKLHFDLVAGTSTGALIAPLVVAGDIATLERIYSNTTTKQVMKKRFLPFALLCGDSLFDTSPLKGLIDEFLPDQKALAILRGKTQLHLAATELQSGKIMYFSNVNPPHPDMESSFMRMTGPELLRTAMLASCNQPIFMPPVEIDGRQYMDGGLREVSPVKVALLSKIRDITIIDMIPAANQADNRRFKKIPEIVGRGLEIMSKEIVDGDIDQAIDAGAKLTIIRPEKALNEDPLQFEREAMRRMMDEGYRTAKSVLGA